MLKITEKELCYLTEEAKSLIAELQAAGIADFDLALEITRKNLGDEKTYSIED